MPAERAAVTEVDRLPHSLYLHVPFCVSKCPYCDFNSHVGLEHLFERYNDALVAEVRRWGQELGGPRLDTIFIGGGTPSRVPAAHVAAVLAAVRQSFAVAPDAEVTMEANPQSAEAEKMDGWLAAGVNRLSLGFQSLDPEALVFLERAHSAGEAVAVFERARRAGFENINCDLIFAVPGLSTAAWRRGLAGVLALAPDHVSAYELTPELGTRLGADVASGRTLMPDDELRIEQYAVADELLGAAGLARYEISNWARPGRQCRHNVAYWSGVPYAAAGAGAHAFLHRDAAPSWLLSDRPASALTARQWNVSSPAAYIEAISKAGNASGGHEWLDLATTVGDLMMMGLRLDEGVDLAAAESRWGARLRPQLQEPISRLRAVGMLEEGPGSRVRASAAGRPRLNAVVAEFLP